MIDRLNRVRAQLEKWRVDGLLITSPTNRRWLSGFTGSAGQLLVTADKALLSTDSRYWTQAEEQSPHFEVFRDERKKEDLGRFLASSGAARIAFEAAHVSVLDANKLKRNGNYRWRALATTLEPMRAVKSADEVAKIRAAAAITDRTVAEFPRLARPGQSEAAVAWDVESFMRRAGADRVGFDVIVASGPNSAKPHHHPGDRLLRAGDFIILDLGAELDGYKSDLTRSFHLGETPEDSFWEIYRVVERAHMAAIGGIRGGVRGKAVDALARDVIVDAGHGDHFGHGTGHAVGLDIHESPRFSPLAEKEIIPTGAVMTVEPGVYVPGFGGVRIEDLVLVTDGGCELLSAAPKSPLIPLM
jgi:Xaa-Pro aminopeptidase